MSSSIKEKYIKASPEPVSFKGTEALAAYNYALVNKNELFKQTDIFNNCNLKLPFMVDLSNRLEYYNLIDKIITDKNELVDEIWK